MEIIEVIDRPIRPLVLVLNSAGLSTKWSCCGFSYLGEEEKKSHANIPFVVLRPLDLSKSHVIWNFFMFSVIAGGQGWVVTPYGCNGEWQLRFEGARDQEFYQNNPQGIHNYETKLIKIIALTKELEFKLKKYDEVVTIIDGNTDYDKLTNSEWQVKPHEISVIKLNIQTKEPSNGNDQRN